MKFVRFFSFVAVIMAMSTACHKTGTNLFKGNYSFKTSGFVTMNAVSEIDSTSYKVTLDSENGQMNILERNESNGDMAITMNIVGGPVLVMQAHAEGIALTLEPVERTITVRNENGLPMEMDVKMSGVADKINDVAMFSFKYEGQKEVETIDGPVKYTISDTQVVCVAKENR